MGFNEEENRFNGSRGFFLFGSFSFFTIACGNVEIPKAVTAGPDYESIPRPGDGYEETFGFGSSREPNACSDVVLRGLGYKGCGVFLARRRRRRK
jgi:hypothetical protein